MIIGAVMWLLGSLFILITMESEDENDPKPHMVLAGFWPFITLWLIIQEISSIISNRDEEE